MAVRASAGSTCAGARLADSTPSTCQFSVSGQVRKPPSRPRTATTLSSRSNGTNASTINPTVAACAPSASQAASASASARIRNWPLPSYPSRRVLRMQGTPTSASARSRSWRLATAANSGTGMSSSRNSVFSASRSWATASARGFGNTGTRAESHSALSAGTFSKSNVATSTLPANSASADSSR